MPPTSQAKSTAWPIGRPDCGSCAYRYDIILPWISIEENAEGEDGLRPEVCHRSVVRRVHAEVRHRLGREGRDHVGEYRQEVFPHRPPPKGTCVMQGIYEVACQPPATAGRSSLYGTSSSRGAPRTKTSSPGGKESPPTSWRTVCAAWKRKALSKRGAMQLMPGAWFTDLRQRGSLSRLYWSR